MKNMIALIILSFFCQCESPQLRNRAGKHDTIIFNGKPKNTYRQVMGDWGIKNLDNEYIFSFVEDSTYIVRADPGNLDLKFNLTSNSKSLSINQYEQRFNEFVIRTNKLDPESTSKSIKIFFAIDTTYNNPVFIRRDLSNDRIFYRTDYYLNWDTLGSYELKIKKKR